MPALVLNRFLAFCFCVASFFGAFVEIMPGKEGLLHISEIEHRRLEKVTEVLKIGDKVDVKLLSIERNGKFKLSRKALLPKPERKENK